MSKSYSIAEARDKLTKLVREAERGNSVELMRRGKPVAVLLSIDEYTRIKAGGVSFWQAYDRFRKKIHLKKLKLDRGVFEVPRDRSPGRRVAW